MQAVAPMMSPTASSANADHRHSMSEYGYHSVRAATLSRRCEQSMKRWSGRDCLDETERSRADDRHG